MASIDTYLEVGSKRVFAGAIEWPGWCRSARDEEHALAALLVYAERYAAVVRGTRPALRAPASASGLKVVERLDGDVTTDFGAPSIAPAADRRPLDTRQLRRLTGSLEACWAAFDDAVAAARGLALRTGPRGGGRDLSSIVGHVVGAEAAYLRRLAARPPKVNEADAGAAIAEVRAEVLDALTRAVTDGLPVAGPRGGKIWKPRYFIRRTAWHALDHAWEIQDRSSNVHRTDDGPRP